MTSRPALPRRVLMTADTVGGVWTYAVDLARALGEEGVQVALATMGELPTEEQRSQARAIGTVELFESSFRLPWMEAPWSDVRLAGDWLLELTAQIAPDVIHLNEPVFGSRTWPVPVLAVAHSCVLSWWQSVWGTPAPDDWSRYRDEMARGLRGADQVAAPSRWMLESVRRWYGVTLGVVIPNGREAGALSPGTKAPLIFAAGRVWDPAKNLLALDEVADGLRWPVYVAGAAGQPGRTDRINAEHVRLLGHLPAEAVAAWLRRASIYAFPARYEPFGLSVLEAALAGCALVLGDLPTLRELWDGAAVFVPPDQPHALRRVLEELIEETLLRQTLAARAHQRALTYTPRRMALAYLQVYSDLLANRGSAIKETACAS